MKTDGVIFDFNGTLFFDSMLHAEAWRRFCPARFGFTPTTEEIRDLYLGQNNLEILRRLMGNDTPVETLRQTAYDKEALYRSICRERPEDFHLTRGAEAFFDTLAEKGVPMFIASGSEYENFAFYMEEMGLKKWFDWDMILYDDHTLPGKPDPAIYFRAAEKIGLPPERLTVFEDSTSGIAAALAAGMKQIFALVPERDATLAGKIGGVTGVIHDFTGAFALL